MEWNKKIKEARQKAKISQADLANRLGLHRSTIANYEIGRRKPSLTELKQIATILHVDTNYLLEGEEVSSEDELLTRASYVFSDLSISVEDKDAIFRDIMEIYMKGKKLNEKKDSRKD